MLSQAKECVTLGSAREEWCTVIVKIIYLRLVYCDSLTIFPRLSGTASLTYPELTLVSRPKRSPSCLNHRQS